MCVGASVDVKRTERFPGKKERNKPCLLFLLLNFLVTFLFLWLVVFFRTVVSVDRTLFI